jgi:hypothetical protein
MEHRSIHEVLLLFFSSFSAHTLFLPLSPSFFFPMSSHSKWCIFADFVATPNLPLVFHVFSWMKDPDFLLFYFPAIVTQSGNTVPSKRPISPGSGFLSCSKVLNVTCSNIRIRTEGVRVKVESAYSKVRNAEPYPHALQYRPMKTNISLAQS